MCEEACPVDAIELTSTSTYDIVGLTRQEMIFDKSKLLKVYDQTAKEEPMQQAGRYIARHHKLRHPRQVHAGHPNPAARTTEPSALIDELPRKPVA